MLTKLRSDIRHPLLMQKSRSKQPPMGNACLLKRYMFLTRPTGSVGVSRSGTKAPARWQAVSVCQRLVMSDAWPHERSLTVKRTKFPATALGGEVHVPRYDGKELVAMAACHVPGCEHRRPCLAPWWSSRSTPVGFGASGVPSYMHQMLHIFTYLCELFFNFLV